MEVTAGDAHTCARKTGGTLWCWGSDSSGQLGGASGEPGPNQVGGDAGWQDIAAGERHTCGIRDGTLFCWGRNIYGEVGDGTRGQERHTPVLIDAASDWQTVVTGALFSCATKVDGALYCWGYNGRGCLGDGDAFYEQPVAVQAPN